MKRNFVSTGLVCASFVALAACGGGAPTEEAPTEAPTEEVAAVEEPAPEETAEPVPAVEPNGNVIEIAMYTKDPEDSSRLQVFKPMVIEATVGDTIKFVPTDPTHQSQSIDGMVPAGVEGWEGKINEEVEFVVPTAGVYGYKCVPHYAAGMVGLIVVDGGGDNVEEAKAVTHPGRAGSTFATLFEDAGL